MTFVSGGYLLSGNEAYFRASDSPSIDAFGRLRVSNPVTLFDSKNIFNDPDIADTLENQPLFYDNAETSGGGTSTAYSAANAYQSLTVANTTAGTRVRQTKRRFNYQPGKSQLIFMTFIMGAQAAGITRREGVFDENNGIFLEDTGSAYRFVVRTSTGGSPSDANLALQANWNIDKLNGAGGATNPSGITINFEKTQIMIIDYEWLGVGRVRVGFVIDGLVYYVHEFNHANTTSTVYMSVPNLPLRSEISNSGAGPEASLIQICSTVISEGGSDDLGITRFISTAGTHVDANTENTEYAIVGLRLRSTHLGATIKILSSALQLQTASSKILWRLKFNPTVASTFTYSGITNSAVEVALGATANTVSGGTIVAGGFMESGGAASGGAGSEFVNISNILILGSKIDGTADTLVLTATPVGGATNVDVEGGITFRELV